MENSTATALPPPPPRAGGCVYVSSPCPLEAQDEHTKIRIIHDIAISELHCDKGECPERASERASERERETSQTCHECPPSETRSGVALSHVPNAAGSYSLLDVRGANTTEWYLL